MNRLRRGWLQGAGASVAAAALAGCDRIAGNPAVVKALASAEVLNCRVQRLIGARALAPEYSPADITPNFKANGTVDPPDADYRAHAAANFADWRLVVDGLVERPLSLSLDQIKALPPRTQITRHDCVEGWSCIGEWTGARIAPLMALAGLKPAARHIVLYCADTLGDAKYYETLDVVDVFHPQTILAYAMNGAPLTVAHGAPLRLRAEHYLGYKQAKYVMRLSAVDRFDNIAGGQGGYWEDRGYDRFGGIRLAAGWSGAYLSQVWLRSVGVATVNMLEAKNSLSRLVEAVEFGAEDEIIIARNGRPAARLVPLETTKKRPLIGVAKGLFEVPDGIDGGNEEIARMFGVD